MQTLMEVIFKLITRLRLAHSWQDIHQDFHQMKNAANLQYSTGEINYLIWANLIQNAIAIESEYVDAVHEMNRTIIQLNYLTAK